jgi:hypothetical protein
MSFYGIETSLTTQFCADRKATEDRAIVDSRVAKRWAELRDIGVFADEDDDAAEAKTVS